MIYLKFPETPEERITAAIINKPSFSNSLGEVLARSYQKDIAKRYSKLISDFIFENLSFPEDGIYCVQEGTFRCFDEKKNAWIDTKLKASDYVVDENSSLWECFNGQFKFLKKVSHSIKSAVKSITENMFDTGKWNQISSIDLNGYTCHGDK